MSTISVLIPVYFKENPETVLKCLDSMINQTVIPDEMVFALDDPSSPEIERVLDEFASKSPIKVVKCYCPRGSGLGAVLKVGVENCSCDYIARMDADDVAVQNRLELERDYLDFHDDIDVVGSNVAEFEDSIDKIIAYRIVPSDDRACKKMLKKRDPINHMTAMFRRESALKAGNYSSEMHSCEDTYLWTNFYAAGLKFANIQDILVYVHAGCDMYERRGGKKAYFYVKRAINYKRQVKLISWLSCFLQKRANHFILVVIGKRLRAFIYEKMLRKKHQS